VRTKKRTEYHGGRWINFEQSEWFYCCAEHAQQLNEPGMHIWEYEEVPTKTAGEVTVVDYSKCDE
jgi:hypothetical protein